MLEKLPLDLLSLLLMIPAYEVLRFIIKLLIPDSLKYYLAKKIELLKGNINSRIPYREVIKQSLSTSLDKNNEIRLTFYKEAYSLFFQVLLIDSTINKKRLNANDAKKLYEDLFDKIQNFRENVFINMIYSPEFFSMLLKVQISLHEDLLYKFHKISNPSLQKKDYKSESDASTLLDDAGKWLIKYNLTNINLKDIIDFHFDGTTEFGAKEKNTIQERTKLN